MTSIPENIHTVALSKQGPTGAENEAPYLSLPSRNQHFQWLKPSPTAFVCKSPLALCRCHSGCCNPLTFLHRWRGGTELSSASIIITAFTGRSSCRYAGVGDFSLNFPPFYSRPLPPLYASRTRESLLLGKALPAVDVSRKINFAGRTTRFLLRKSVQRWPAPQRNVCLVGIINTPYKRQELRIHTNIRWNRLIPPNRRMHNLGAFISPDSGWLQVFSHFHSFSLLVFASGISQEVKFVQPRERMSSGVTKGGVELF